MSSGSGIERGPIDTAPRWQDIEPSRLILVGSAPGSGKTTLARLLAGELGLPLFSRDVLKEVLLDVLTAPDRSTSESLGRASFRLFYSVLDTLVGMVPGVIAECNFTRGRAEAELRPFLNRASTVLLHCTTSALEIERRIRARERSVDRHPGHHDVANLPSVLARLESGAFDPLDLPVPTLLIDTTDGYEPLMSDIVRFLRAPSSGTREDWVP